MGAAHWTLKEENLFQNSPNPPFSGITATSYNGTDFAWGIGVQAHVEMFGVRLEYEGFNVVNYNLATVASVSVFLNF